MAFVPNVPGVPALLNGFSDAVSDVLMTADTIASFLFAPQQWGVYANGVPVLVFDSFLGIEFRQDWNVSDFVLESGGFESYDKVDSPYDVRVTFATGGSVQNRTDMLTSIDAIAGDLNFYSVVTPEKTYDSVNVERFDYKRTGQSGAGLLVINMELIEIRVAPQDAGSITDPQNPEGTTPVNGGQVQATDATSAQTSTMTIGAAEDGGIQIDGQTVNGQALPPSTTSAPSSSVGGIGHA